MIKNVIVKRCLKGSSDAKDNLNYWLSRTPEERVATVDYLRKQYYGGSARLQRSARVVQRS